MNLGLMRECGRGVLRSKRFAMNAMRKAAENGHASACAVLAEAMFLDKPYTRRVGRIKREDFDHTDSNSDPHVNPPPDLRAMLRPGCLFSMTLLPGGICAR